MSPVLNRRKFLTYLGTGTAALAAARTGLDGLVKTAEAKGMFHQSNRLKKPKYGPLKFTPIEPSTKDELVLPKGYRYDVIASYGDKINPKGDTFGYNNDYTLFFPMENKKTADFYGSTMSIFQTCSSSEKR